MTGIKRSITHWTAGGGRASDVDRKHYHRITEFDGRIVTGNEAIEDNIVTSDGDYAAHTLNLNTGSAGFAMAGMRGAVENPFDPGPSPINREQFEAHCKMLADFHASHGIPVSQKTCLTHAEVEPVLGVKQRGKWDISRLPFEPDIRGPIAVGDYMRARVRAYLKSPVPEVYNRATLSMGDHGAFVLDLQDQLARLRYFAGRIDGDFGPLTRASVMEFQADAGLAVDGIVGPNTWEALRRAKPRPERDVSKADLKYRGSETLDATGKIKAVTATGGGIAGVGAVVEETMSASQKASGAVREAQGTLDALQGFLTAHWPLLLLGGVGVAVWYAVNRIERARVRDAQTGANRKR